LNQNKKNVHLGLQLISPVSRGTAGGAKPPPEKCLPTLEKYAGHSLEVLGTVWKFGPLPETSTPPLVSQAGYGPAADATDKSNTVFVAWKG